MVKEDPQNLLVYIIQKEGFSIMIKILFSPSSTGSLNSLIC